MTYLLKVRCELCLWNAEYNIVVESCHLVLRTVFSMKESDVIKKKWHRYTHTHWHKHTQTHTETQVHLQALTQHKHNLSTITNHHTAEVLKTRSQLYDSIKCRLTARTRGSAKGEILDWEFGNKQTDQIKTTKSSPQHRHCLWCPQSFYLMANKSSFTGKSAGEQHWPLLTSRYWLNEENMELCYHS
jgi:hypothetical protein